MKPLYYIHSSTGLSNMQPAELSIHTAYGRSWCTCTSMCTQQHICSAV